MLSRARSRAWLHGSRWRSVLRVRAIEYHISGELSHQKCATSVCQGERRDGVVTPSPPYALTSLRSRAYLALVSGRGGAEWNWVALRIANGVTFPHSGAKANGDPGVNR